MFSKLLKVIKHIFSSSNQIFHYTRCITPKRVTSLWGSSPRHCARATQLFSKKCRSGGKPLATLCPIWPVRDLNLRPPAPETNALPLDQLMKHILPSCRQGGRKSKDFVSKTTLITWSGFNFQPGHVIASLDNTLHELAGLEVAAKKSLLKKKAVKAHFLSTYETDKS